MKTIIIITFCLLLTSVVIPQSTFNYLYSSPLNEISKSLIEDDDGNIYIAVKNYNYALIIKLDFEGSFLDSISIYNHEGTCNLEELIKIDDTHFVALGDWTSDTTSELWYVKLDNDLQIIDDKKLNSNGWYLFELHHIINHNGNIVFTAQYNVTSGSEKDVCMYEITENGTLIRNMFFNTTFIYNAVYSFLQDIHDSTYKVFAKSPLNNRVQCTLNIVDTNFYTIDHSSALSDHINNNTSARWMNDSTYLLAGKWYFSSTDEWDLEILKMTRTDSILSNAYFGKQDTIDWPATYESLDFISPNNIFLAGSSNSNWFPFQNEPSWIMLNVLDSNLNLKNQKFYGGDAFYIINAILATQDSGCLISCSRYDYLTQNEENDVYILKVNKDGLLVSTPENPIINTKTCYIYPNPGNDLLNINSPLDQLHIQLFNLTGILECAAELSVGTNSISVSNLPAGIYLYRIFDQNNRIIQSGEWIKM
jgi:hypothetical protein